MGAEKRAQLIASGQLNPDGSRIHRCPVCGNVLPDDHPAVVSAPALEGPDAVAGAEPVAVDSTSAEV